MSLPRFHLIGPGRLGQTLTRLLHARGLVEIYGIAGRTPTAAETAIHWIGAGHAATISALPPANLVLLATQDDKLVDACTALACSAAIQPGTVVFHASGSASSDLLAPLRAKGALIASAHPLMSFTTPEVAIQQFSGCYCALEGDEAALSVLEPLLTALGAHCFRIRSEDKLLYHGAAVLACNHLVSLMETALQTMSAAGVPRDQAWPALRPLIQATLDNIDRHAPVQSTLAPALTGPIARGDAALVQRQYRAIVHQSPDAGRVYAALGMIGTTLSGAPATALDSIRQTLAPPEWGMHTLGYVESCFKEKFAIPRQPGLTPSATAVLRLKAPFDTPDAVRGLEQFSHLWVMFAFHATADAGWRPTVRPPKLGGNTRVGVFATRATHRPNPMGMSVVKLVKVDTRNGVAIHIEGGDLLDGTPILDIKPYLGYADAIADARDGYADRGETPMAVEFAPDAESALATHARKYPKLRQLIIEVLAQDPRPGYADDTDRLYGMVLYQLNIRWQCRDGIALVTEVSPA
ncbi:tRNA (N6-threonylcarbamoyladenosine(37)-N6)-methyltransferase TrmO [Burkholderiaceae bacterium DAT-1]|nr:tRNA (N6-threonylcarbamoyladenosine(37)-N6)-methyltransferase TrmO [Burkholderiaceae bacterium DAT-1]